MSCIRLILGAFADWLLSSSWNFCITGIPRSVKLVGFLQAWDFACADDTQACENLVGYSINAAIFKKPQFVPINDLKLLVRDYPVSPTQGCQPCARSILILHARP
jgi:hypothetical protein